jgi:arabinose-5-phosphate isomerase
MLAIGDALALTLMELKGVSRSEFGLRHHGGYLGKAARTDGQ